LYLRGQAFQELLAMHMSRILPTLLCGLGLVVAAPAQAQDLGDFFESLFGGGTRARPAPQPRLHRQRPSAVYREAAFGPASRDVMSDQFRRQMVQYPGGGKVGSIVVDTRRHYLYLVTAPDQAIRYGIGVARSGFEWGGHKTVSRKAEWPEWTPPPDMLRRRPELPTHMEGGPDNPLGARALYLGSSMYRIHGTNEPWTIGQNVSSGCIRMMNDDVIDLYERVRIGAGVTVL
jgi:lipoprotein-anchoring transpeptidase ErfK/SrfK